MQIDFSDATSQVYGDKRGRAYKVKITCPKAGMYIGAFRVIEALRGNDDYVVYQPEVHIGNQEYFTNYEYDKSGDLWKLFEHLAISAVEKHKLKKKIVIAGQE